MSSTLTTLSAAVTRRLGRPTTDALLASSDITGALNDAAQRYSVEYPWPWLITSENISTTNGTDTYTAASAAPATYVDTISIVIAGQPPLTRMTHADLLRQFPTAASGTPLFFARTAGSLVVRPVPITGTLPTLVHRYHSTESTLASSNDTLLIPVFFEQAVVELAAAELLYRASDVQRAKIAESQYEAIRNRMLEYVRRQQAMEDGNDMVPAQPQMPLPGKAEAAS